MAALARRGVAPVDGVEQAPPGCTVVIRSHGVDKATLEELGRKGYPVEDATCPFVQRIQRMAQQARSEGIPIIIVGDGAHPRSAWHPGLERRHGPGGDDGRRGSGAAAPWIKRW